MGPLADLLYFGQEEHVSAIGRKHESGMRSLRGGPVPDGPLPLPPMRHSPLTNTEVAALLRPYGAISLDEEAVLAAHYASQLYNHGRPIRAVVIADDLYEDLEQLNFLIKSVAVLLTEHSKRLMAERETAESMRERDQLRMTMFVHAEGLYYGAHRVQKLLLGGKLPHVTGYQRVDAITDVRNHLLEHPLQGYRNTKGRKAAVHPIDGPMILTSTLTDQPRDPNPHADRVMDRGLFVNVRAFKANLNPVLTRALDAVGGKIDTES